MLNSIKIATIIMLVGFASACTPMRWEKPGATQAQADEASAECRHKANEQSWRDQWTENWPPPWYDPNYMPPYYGTGEVPFWQDYPQTFEMDEDLTRFCMHSKGYRLVSVRE